MDTYQIRISEPEGKNLEILTCRALSAVAALEKATRMAPQATRLEIWKDDHCLYSRIADHGPVRERRKAGAGEGVGRVLQNSPADRFAPPTPRA